MASGNEVMKKQIENEWRQKIENAKHRRSHFCRKIPPYFTGHRTNLDFSEKSCEVSSVPQFTGIISKLCHALLDHQRYKKETDLCSVWHHYSRNVLILFKNNESFFISSFADAIVSYRVCVSFIFLLALILMKYRLALLEPIFRVKIDL